MDAPWYVPNPVPGHLPYTLGKTEDRRSLRGDFPRVGLCPGVAVENIAGCRQPWPMTSWPRASNSCRTIIRTMPGTNLPGTTIERRGND